MAVPMDLNSGLAVRLTELDDAMHTGFFDEGDREVLPRPAALAMPRQRLISIKTPSFGARTPAASDTVPVTSPADIRRRRIIFFGSTFALTALALLTPTLIFLHEGFEPIELVALVLLTVLLFAISAWFVNAVAGLIVLTTGRGRDPVCQNGPTPAPRARTAVLMPLYHEHAEAAVGRLARMERSLAALGAERHFDLFVLSDSRKDEVAEAEWAAVQALREIADCPVYYRRRAENHERKVGNLSEWVRRFGSAYDYMVVADADSSMSGATLLKLVDAMERHPGVGLIQTTPTIVGGQTLFSRASQFAVKLYGRVAAAGLAWWCGSEATYWGHNAIVRIEAFAACAGLPKLKGRKPFGGHVMSHDVVEAALLRRGGWAVHLAADLPDSHEETPPSLADFMVRERRWAQGNLQHLALIGAPGLHWVNRVQFMMGAMAYLASPLWLLSIVAGLAIELQSPTDWDSFWYVLSPKVTPFLWGSALCAFLLLGPKLMGLALVLSRRDERKAFGGTALLLRNAACEALLSAITAPILMARNSRTVFEALIGRDSGWTPQRRTADALTAMEGVRQHQWELGVGLALSSALIFRPDLCLVFAPILAPLLCTGPLSALLSDVRVGMRAKAKAFLATPEELTETGPAIPRDAAPWSLPAPQGEPAPVIRLVAS
jgi:membrane glycosyltransferase